LLYYITDRSQFPGEEPARRRAVIDKIAEAVHAGVDYIQLREKDLTTRDLEILAREVVVEIAKLKKEKRELRTRVLINSHTDIALAVGACGVHLRGDDISAHDVRRVLELSAHRPADRARFCVAVSCHSPSEVFRAEAEGANFAVLAPIFEKKVISAAPATGLKALREACGAKIPVLALGGVTLENAADCFDAGAAGIAAIRLFQENRIDAVVARLRKM
jgi:thiamine-phosphate pyrophosphorylase